MAPYYWLTGFPGFIGTKLIERLIELHPNTRFAALVQTSELQKAEAAARKLPARIELIPGDITQPDLGMDRETTERLQNEITHVFHLAAIYDLATPEEIAHRVNVLGTTNVNRFVASLPNLERYVYFSTAYVSGRRAGKILETELNRGQTFKNFYESTKFEAEHLVRAMGSRVSATIIRPGIVIGDSKTGETAKFDGPYFILRFLDKFASLPIPFIGRGLAPINLVPVDYVVDATIQLAHSSSAGGKTIHLTDPRPHTAGEVYEKMCELLLEKKPSFSLPQSLVTSVLSIGPLRRWVGVPCETLEYFECLADYDSSQAESELSPAGISCPDLLDYLPAIVSYYSKNRTNSHKIVRVR